MRVALIHDFLTQYGGAEKVLEAFHEIWPQAPIFTLFYDAKMMKGYFKDCNIKVSPIQNLPFGVKKYRWYLPLMPSAIERFNLSEFDLVISDCSAYSKGVLTKPGTLHISYLHTPTRYLWSDAYEYIDSLKGAEKVVSKFLAPVLTRLRVWDQIAAQRPDYLIANSAFIAQRIKHYYRRDSTVIYPPVETSKFSIANKIQDYYLIISRFRPYKRVDLAIKAFNKLRMPLKIIGTGEDKLLKKMAGPNIEFLGFVSDREKAKYLSHCKAFIHPQEEDFGITPIEAMASGRPVIAYKKGGAMETVVDGLTGKFFKNQTVEDLADAVLKLNLNEVKPQKIREHAEKFSKKQFKKDIKNFVQKRLPH
ncbi:glycosyltransferase [bacterium]|nr:glycosyltransferase [bacterium]